MEASEIALVVCTRNRPNYVERLLSALPELSIHPTIIIFVDSSDNQETENLIRSASSCLRSRVRYIKSKPGLPLQRNVGVDFLVSQEEFDDVKIVSFTDDDCLPSKDYFAAVRKSFASLPNCVGVTGIMSPPNFPEVTRLHVIFGLRSRQPGKILKSGITTSPMASKFPEIVEWMPGGSMNIAREIFDSLKFDSSLRMYGEDLKMALCMEGFGRIYVDPEARITHLEAQTGKDPHYKVIVHTDAIRWQLSEEFPARIKKFDVLLSIFGEIFICYLNFLRARFPGRQFDTIRGHVLFLLGIVFKKDNVQKNSSHAG